MRIRRSSVSSKITTLPARVHRQVHVAGHRPVWVGTGDSSPSSIAVILHHDWQIALLHKTGRPGQPAVDWIPHKTGKFEVVILYLLIRGVKWGERINKVASSDLLAGLCQRILPKRGEVRGHVHVGLERAHLGQS